VKWEYRLQRVSLRNPEAVETSVGESLNGLGREGWEAVAWVPNPESRYESYVLLKRVAE
jgi:hypothetical protein